MNHHAFGIEAEQERGVAFALLWVERELGMKATGNPDIVILRHGLLSVDDARRVAEVAGQKAFSGDARAIVVAADRAYHEAQNALLKIFEEPPRGTHLFFILPSFGGLLPTLRSRLQIMGLRDPYYGFTRPILSESAKEFISATREKRAAIAKKLATGKDDDDRRAHRGEAIAIINGIEALIYTANVESPTFNTQRVLLEELAIFRDYLYDRSAPVKQILEHLALVVPKNLI